MTKEEFAHFSPTIPKLPGVYRYIAPDDEILYVGKAKNLKNRLSSYFSNSKQLANKTKILVRRAERIEFTIVDTEQDALLLENSLIKLHQPRYNVRLKDDKTYPYICIKKERFPRVFFTRDVVKDGSEYIGPFTSIYAIRAVLDLIKKLFPLRNCNLNLSEKNIKNEKFKVCLEYHIGNCKAPCVGFEAEEIYNNKINEIRQLIKGNFKTVTKSMSELMQEFASKYEFEKAEEVKQKIELLQNYQSKSTVVNPSIHNVDVFSIVDMENIAIVNFLKIMSGSIVMSLNLELKKNLNDDKETLLRIAMLQLKEKYNSDAKDNIVPFELETGVKEWKTIVPIRGDKKKLLSLSTKNALYMKQQRLTEIREQQEKRNHNKAVEQLQKDLGLKVLPKHIECFDNSNIQGHYPVASMVVFKNGKPANSEYRKFHIKTVEGPDDFASMEEVVYRRYKRLKDENKALPQLIVIDGGKGQLGAAVKILLELNILHKTNVIGIAKKLEEIFRPGDPIPLHIDKKSVSLKIIQHIRNEAHRFAITFHRDVRSKQTFTTELEQIKGIGDKTASELLRRFKSVKVISETSFKDLEKIIGLSKAKLVFEYFNA